MTALIVANNHHIIGKEDKKKNKKSIEPIIITCSTCDDTQYELGKRDIQFLDEESDSSIKNITSTPT